MHSTDDKPQFLIKNNAQKRGYQFSEFLTDDVLSDVCYRLTGQRQYDVTFDSDGYNIGRLAILCYNDSITYISFSEHTDVRGRNSFFQSFASAFSAYFSDATESKRIVFYFLPTMKGSFESDYFRFMYRLMLTSGVEFINAKGFLRYPIKAFSTIDDVIAARDSNRRSNTSNNSTYLTYADNNTAQIYAKTYGASKKEAILVCQAAARLSRYVELFEIREQNMRELPSPDKAAIEKLGNVTVIQTNREMERIALKQDANFRSPTFIYNLFQKYQIKECAFCDCQIPQIIAGAHIWPVADIKRDLSLSEDEQLHCAVDGDNGLWLCYNHHKMFDENIIKITDDGRIVWDNSKSNAFRVFIRKATPKRYILHDCWSERFEYYLQKRNAMLSS